MAIALAAEMFPVLRPDPLVQDDYPLVGRPALPLTRALETGSETPALTLASIIMVAGAAAVVLIPSRRRRRHSNKEAIA